MSTITQSEAISLSEKAAVRFKPQLLIGNGCNTYPAVNAQGQTSGGLKPTGGSMDTCILASSPCSLYVRSAWQKNVWATMYAWYFPKDSPKSGKGHRHDWENIVVWLENPAPECTKLLAVSTSSDNGEYLKYSPPDKKFIAGNAPLVKYESVDGNSEAQQIRGRLARARDVEPTA
ncbi:necrosis inducing like protein NPP1 type [Phytophthora sojae]|uniref:Necrosis inducing like protein NPP1 type n=1 Tax=Phytophthora sojae (strain P6497) TaxID=1094619 RepID=G5A7M7_PHYSP|nr:necrosis inducing like protein NPP1 type [Phytophthora sojae]EGZ07903.1 necrosis inducing like protein NPP1 type [Phytophthora sojae]|eukprot:XP_009536075.1 necrosis inducing like protein NPP1 type [Phytophthora sojae]